MLAFKTRKGTGKVLWLSVSHDYHFEYYIFNNQQIQKLSYYFDEVNTMLKGPRKFLNGHSGEVLPEVHHVSGVVGFEAGPGENYFNSLAPQICTVRNVRA